MKHMWFGQVDWQKVHRPNISCRKPWKGQRENTDDQDKSAWQHYTYAEWTWGNAIEAAQATVDNVSGEYCGRITNSEHII